MLYLHFSTYYLLGQLLLDTLDRYARYPTRCRCTLHRKYVHKKAVNNNIVDQKIETFTTDSLASEQFRHQQKKHFTDCPTYFAILVESLKYSDFILFALNIQNMLRTPTQLRRYY